MADSEISKRQVAYKVRIADIINNKYVKEGGWLPNYVLLGEKKVSRANILGVIVSKTENKGEASSQSFILDDGTGRISLRFFDGGTGLNVGELVVVIGKPREFENERYLVPELIKKVKNIKWFDVRKIELSLEKQLSAKKEDSDAGLVVETEEFLEEETPYDKVVNLIRKNDAGDGVDFELISSVLGESFESQIKKLLEKGDVFEVRPGRYKVLE